MQRIWSDGNCRKRKNLQFMEIFSEKLLPIMEIYGNIWNRTAGTREMCIAGESWTSLRYENKTEKTRALL